MAHNLLDVCFADEKQSEGDLGALCKLQHCFSMGPGTQVFCGYVSTIVTQHRLLVVVRYLMQDESKNGGGSGVS